VETLVQFRDVHRGEKVVVCGCGESLRSLTNPDACVTIGVNDVGRLFTPTYLVVVNPLRQFASHRLRFIASSRAHVLFTQMADLKVTHPRVVKFRLGSYGGTDLSDPDFLHYTQNSPYVAMCLAAFMGARRIGLIGVDFTDGNFFERTGTHPLATSLDEIDREYGHFAEACAARGVEVVNLSAVSRLQSLRRVTPEAFVAEGSHTQAACGDPGIARRRLFAVNYQFLSCGDVFTEGLRHAAADLGIAWADAGWDDPDLPARVAAFHPDLLFVVHGRRFAARWKNTFREVRSAVWLLDEPYEVDDTLRFSGTFGRVFLNDGATIDHHTRASLLPVCYDPHVHFTTSGPRPHDVGFIGGANPTRERMLRALADKGLLTYVVGGPWSAPQLTALCQARNVVAGATADLYRSTKIVINVFRDHHHFNRQQIKATAMNPRIYEALACGALVVSERRLEIERRLPDLPTFQDERELIELVERFLTAPADAEAVRASCAARIAGDTYADRLTTAINVVFGSGAQNSVTTTVSLPRHAPVPGHDRRSVDVRIGDGAWEICGPVDCATGEDGLVTLRSRLESGIGSERGLVSVDSHDGIDLSFEVLLPVGACFIAKINQEQSANQLTNSYHLYCEGQGAYLARHHHVFFRTTLRRNTWERFRLVYRAGVLGLYIGGVLVHRARDDRLRKGYAFLGVKSGAVALRKLRIAGAEAGPGDASAGGAWRLVHGHARTNNPYVSIVTTVYDRVDCLRACIQSVKQLTYPHFEHIIVSDAPPPAVVDAIARVVRDEDDGRMYFVNLARRSNNWGIAPAAAGLKRAAGEYVCFLSDDNGYTPEHVSTLVRTLEEDRRIGFAYSSCRYDGRLVLAHPVPGPGRIDLGQPMFRRNLFELYLADDLPFDVMGWDWALIETLMKRGVRWKHVNVPSFIFRLAKYPQLMARVP